MFMHSAHPSFKSKCTKAPKTHCWPDGLRVHLSSDLQTVEPLHVTDGTGQDLSWSHGGHLSAGLGQVTVHPQPRLETHRKKNTEEIINNVMSYNLNPSSLNYCRWESLILNSLLCTDIIKSQKQETFYVIKRCIMTEKRKKLSPQLKYHDYMQALNERNVACFYF